ncbi:MAG: hypothetical protein Q7R43_04805 [Candidatus Daviesbacteria bacterium]|nr:hypothetical protein [Candidatus Daviesbacteria bacterium]
MSPEIRIDGKLVADVPDETGLYRMLDGRPLYVDVSGIEARNSKQVLILGGVAVGGRRLIGLTQEGKGSSSKTNKGGDGKSPTLEITLHDRPIRISYSTNKWDWRDRRSYYNPKWTRSNGRG